MYQQNAFSRRRFLKGLAAASAGAASLQLLAACAPATESTPGAEGDAAPSGEAVTLRVQVPADAGQSAMPVLFADRFTEETGVNVEIEETIYAEIENKTQTGYISGTLPDLLYGHHRWLFILYLQGVYLEIDDYLDSSPPEDFDDIYPSVMAGNSFNGVNFSMPGVVHPGGNIAAMYNISMLEEKGLPLPTREMNLLELAELGREAADTDNGIFGLGFDGMNSFHYYSNTSRSWPEPDSTDGWVMNAEGTDLTFDTPLHAEIGDWYLGLLNDGVAPRKADYIEESANRLFIAGLTAIHCGYVGGVANALAQIDGAFEIDAIPLPVGPEGRQGTCYSGNQHMISSLTENPDEAWELLKLYTGTDAGISMVVDGNLQPNGHKSAWTAPEVNEVNYMFGVMDELLTAGIEPFPMPANTRFTEANDVFLNEIDLIWEGEVPWAEHAPVIEEKVQAVLDLELPG